MFTQCLPFQQDQWMEVENQKNLQSKKRSNQKKSILTTKLKIDVTTLQYHLWREWIKKIVVVRDPLPVTCGAQSVGSLQNDQLLVFFIGSTMSCFSSKKKKRVFVMKFLLLRFLNFVNHKLLHLYLGNPFL